MAKRTGPEFSSLSELELIKFYGYENDEVVEAINTLMAATKSTGLNPEVVAEYLKELLLSGKDEIGEDKNDLDEADTFVGLAVMERLLRMMPKSNEVWVPVGDLIEVLVTAGNGWDKQQLMGWVRDVESNSMGSVKIEGEWIMMDSDLAFSLRDDEEEVSYRDVSVNVEALSMEAFVDLLSVLPGYLPTDVKHVGVTETKFVIDRSNLLPKTR